MHQTDGSVTHGLTIVWLALIDFTQRLFKAEILCLFERAVL